MTTINQTPEQVEVKPLECRIFMRDVKSRNYFEHLYFQSNITANR